MSKFVQYLGQVKPALVSLSSPKALHLVMGNEACDLDSAVSALVYAFLLHSLRTDKQKTVVPVLNIPQEDYELKTEVTYWLNKHNISSHHIVFRDDLDLTEMGTANTVLTLVDHNVLKASDRHLESKVISILDHHKLERPNPESVKDGVVIEMVGSCSTLVTESVLKRLPEILEDTTASLLFGTIILDTVNLSEAAKRVTEKDKEMCKELERHISSPRNSTTDIFQELTAAKSNISNLTSDQLLRKDVKVVENKHIRIGIASVPMSVKTYLERPDVSHIVHEHSEKHNYNILIVMGITLTADSVKRDIAVCSQNAELRIKVAQYLIDARGKMLQLSPVSTDVNGCLAYQQGNHAASRKVVLPFIREWLSTNAI